MQQQEVEQGRTNRLQGIKRKSVLMASSNETFSGLSQAEAETLFEAAEAFYRARDERNAYRVAQVETAPLGYCMPPAREKVPP